MLNIIVFFGGKSVEHDISVITGTLTLNSLNKTIYTPIPIFIDGEGKFFTGKLNSIKDFSCKSKQLKAVTFFAGDNALYLKKGKKIKPLLRVDCAINCTHGNCGEDGVISSLMKLCNIPLASPDIFCSAFSMDKEYTKIVLKGLGIKTLNYKVVKRETFLKNNLQPKPLNLSYPIIIKPARLGSSIGISVVREEKELSSALENAFKYDDKLLIEPLVENFIEINCAVYKGENIVVSQLERPITSKEILTFKDKYEGEGQREFPAKISEQLSKKIKQISRLVYEKLSFSGVIRIDYLIAENTVYLNEINSVPGSLAYYLFCADFKEFSYTLTSLINNAIKEHKSQQKNLINFATELLKGVSSIKK